MMRPLKIVDAKSKRILKMRQYCCFTLANNRYHIEAALSVRIFGMSVKKSLRRFSHVLLLSRADCFQRMNKFIGMTRPYLTKNQRAAVLKCNDVNLTMASAEITLQNLMPPASQIGSCKRLALTTVIMLFSH